VGLGEKRKQTLLKRYQSLEEIRKADLEEIAKLPTFNRVLAERVLLHLNESEAPPEAIDELTPVPVSEGT
jgi:excinuclease ABC subunit C